MFCFIFYKKLKTKPLRLFFIYSITIVLSVFLSVIFLKAFTNKLPYSIFFRIFQIVEFTLIALFIYTLIINKKLKKLILFSIIPFALFSILMFWIRPKQYIDSIPAIVEAFLLIVFFIFYFYEKIKTVYQYPLTQTITFWICVAFFMYFTGNFFFFIFMDTYAQGQGNSSNEFFAVYIFFTLIKNIILCAALLAKEPTQESQELQIPDDLNLDDFLPENTKPES